MPVWGLLGTSEWPLTRTYHFRVWRAPGEFHPIDGMIDGMKCREDRVGLMMVSATSSKADLTSFYLQRSDNIVHPARIGDKDNNVLFDSDI